MAKVRRLQLNGQVETAPSLLRQSGNPGRRAAEGRLGREGVTEALASDAELAVAVHGTTVKELERH